MWGGGLYGRPRGLLTTLPDVLIWKGTKTWNS